MKKTTRRTFLKKSGSLFAGACLAPSLITTKTRAREIDTDFLIIGSGFCGTALAQKLATTGARITIVESGDGSNSWDAQSLNRVSGVPPELAAQLSIATHRQIGGTSALWNSSCPIPDPKDFRSYSEFGYGVDWPFGMEELNGYIRKAALWLEIGIPEAFTKVMGTGLRPSPYSIPAQSLANLRRATDLNHVFPAMMGVSSNGHQLPKRVKPIILQLPQRFPNVELRAGTCVKHLLFDGKRVTGAIAQRQAGRDERLKAKHVIAACGGLQNARLLQLSAATSEASPLQDHAEVVGHHLMDHPHQHIVGSPSTFAAELFSKDTWLHVYDGYLPQKELGLGGHVFRIGFIPAKTPSRFINGQSDDSLLVIDSMWEQEPVSTNLIELNQDIADRFGSPIASLHSELSSLDRRSMERSNKRLEDIANVLCAEWRQLPLGLSSHHIMGTTPYVSPQREGILDPHSRVIGTDNLWVIGSSNFPTGLSVNPTLIATALSFKLAEHLSTRF